MKNVGVLCEKTEDESDTKFIENIPLSDSQMIDGLVFDATWRNHFTGEGVTNALDDADGVLRQSNLVNVFIVGVDDEAEALVFER